MNISPKKPSDHKKTTKQTKQEKTEHKHNKTNKKYTHKLKRKT